LQFKLPQLDFIKTYKIYLPAFEVVGYCYQGCAVESLIECSAAQSLPGTARYAQAQ
jgi:hypothetical protein